MAKYGYRFYAEDEKGNLYSPYMDYDMQDGALSNDYSREYSQTGREDFIVVDTEGKNHINRKGTIRVGGSAIGVPDTDYSLFSKDDIDELELDDEYQDRAGGYSEYRKLILPKGIHIPKDWARETMSNAILDTDTGIRCATEHERLDNEDSYRSRLYKVELDDLIKAQDVIDKNLSGQRDFSPELVAKYIKPVKGLDLKGYAKAVAQLKDKIPYEDRNKGDYDKYLSDLLEKYLEYDDKYTVSDVTLKNISADLSKDCYISDSIIDACSRRY